jgi:Domain of unknown function (DUF4190)
MLDDETVSSKARSMYRIVGADQKEYGPVSSGEMRAWILQGRANGQTLARFDDGPWKTLSTFPEFAEALRALPQPPPSLVQAAITGRRLATNSLAVAGLVMGILSVTLGLLCCGPLFNILGVIFSAIALSQIKKHPDHYTGRNMAITGLILSVLGFVLFIIFLVFGVLTGFMESWMRRGG